MKFKSEEWATFGNTDNIQCTNSSDVYLEFTKGEHFLAKFSRCVASLVLVGKTIPFRKIMQLLISKMSLNYSWEK